MKNPGVDACIAKSPGFARPILRHVRTLMHRGDRRIEETIKWGVPAFEREGLVAMMGAFKQHVAFGFWHEKSIRARLGRDADRVFPKNAQARTTWARLTPGRRREYLDWLVGAKRAETRGRRLAQALAWLSAGKPLRWKYQDC